MKLGEVLRVMDKQSIVLIRERGGLTLPLYSGDVWGTVHLRNLHDREVTRIGKAIWECKFHIEITIGG